MLRELHELERVEIKYLQIMIYLKIKIKQFKSRQVGAAIARKGNASPENALMTESLSLLLMVGSVNAA